MVNRFSNDWNSISRRYDANGSPDQRRGCASSTRSGARRLAEIDFDKLSQEGKVDYVLLNKELKHELLLLDRQEKQRTETASLLPFADRLLALQDPRRDLKPSIRARHRAHSRQSTKQVDSLRVIDRVAAAA